MYGKYHITNGIELLQRRRRLDTVAVARLRLAVARPCQTTLTTNAQGQVVSTGQLLGMAPIYQELRCSWVSQRSPSRCSTRSYPYPRESQIQTLSGFMIAGSDPGDYGQLQCS